MNKKGHHEQGLTPYITLVAPVIIAAGYAISKIREVYQRRHNEPETQPGELEKKIRQFPERTEK